MPEDWAKRALEKLRRDGWTQGHSGFSWTGNHTLPCCAGGAIAWAITGDPQQMYVRRPDVQQAFKVFCDAAGLDVEEDYYYDAVQMWNDYEVMSEEEVFDTFKRVIEAEVASTT